MSKTAKRKELPENYRLRAMAETRFEGCRRVVKIIQESLACSPKRSTKEPCMSEKEVSEMESLRAKLREATKPRGSKSALAKLMGVSRQRMNDWLKGTRCPSPETTLRLAKWASQAEQQKCAAPVEARTTLKAQAQKPSTNEKPNSDQRRK